MSTLFAEMQYSHIFHIAKNGHVLEDSVRILRVRYCFQGYRPMSGKYFYTITCKTLRSQTRYSCVTIFIFFLVDSLTMTMFGRNM